MACMGSVSEGVVDYCDDEQREGNSKPIDIETLLSNVVPQLLLLSGQHKACLHFNSRCLSWWFRLPLLARQEFCLRISICQASSSSNGGPVYFCCHQRLGRPKCGSSNQNLRRQGYSKVSRCYPVSLSSPDVHKMTASRLGWTSQ